MHQDLLQFQTCQTFSMSKTKSQDRDTLKSYLIDALGHVDQNYPFLEKHFWAIILFWIEMINLEPKANPFKTILIWEEML